MDPDVPEAPIEAFTAAPRAIIAAEAAAFPLSPKPDVVLLCDWKRPDPEMASRLILASVRTVKRGERRLRRSQSRQYRSVPALTIWYGLEPGRN